MPRTDPLLVGVVSDTHGLLRPELLTALAGCAHILHAGDVGDAVLLARLRALAPLTAVRGNTDTGAWALRLPETAFPSFGLARLVMIHDVHALRCDPAHDRLAAVVSGHSHVPRNETLGGVLYFNPGSAGPRRFDRPVTLGRLHIVGRRVQGEIVHLRAR